MLRVDINLVFTIINLLVLYLLMKKFLFGPVVAVMEKRKAMIEEQFANAASAEKNANELKSQYEDTLKTANADADNIIQEAKTTAKTEYDRIVSDANSQAGKIIENAEKTVASQREKTLRGLESQIAGLAIDTAAKVIGEQAGSLDNAKLYDEFLNKAGDAHDTDIN